MEVQPPEIVIIDDGGRREPPPPGRPPPHARQWTALAIGAVLIFALGMAVGTHMGDSDYAATGMTQSSTARPSTATQPATQTATAQPSTAQSSVTSAGAAPTIRSISWSQPPTPGSEGWELVGYRAGGASGADPGLLVRFDPTGTVITTQVPALFGDGPASFAVTDTAAIVLPGSAGGDRFVVADGRPAAPAPRDLAAAGAVFPGTDGQHVWAARSPSGQPVAAPGAMTLAEMTADGAATGVTIPIPEAISATAWFSLASDGAGHVLASGVGGVYDLHPEGARLVTHGQLLAKGPTGYLAWECDEAGNCAMVVIDRSDRARRTVPNLAFNVTSGSTAQGAISPDGRLAALFGFGGPDGLAVNLIDLATGAFHTVSARPPHGYLDTTTTLLAFTPDSKYLLAATAAGVVPIDTASGLAGDPLPVPTLDTIAMRAAAHPLGSAPSLSPPTR